MTMKKEYMTAEDISKTLGVSKSVAYKIIRKCNADLQSKGYLTISGKVSSTYFREKWYGMDGC